MSAAPVLAMVGASRRYGERVALSELSLSVAAGEVHAIIGLNGAGKTTAMRAIVGQTALDAGEIEVLGEAVGDAQRSTWARVGFVIDQPFGYPELDVRANLVLAARLHGLDLAAATLPAAAWIEWLDLHEWATTRAAALSMGNRQRVGLASALVHDPDLIVLDEPTNALDPAGVLLLRDAIARARGRGAGVLVSSHHLDEVSRLADRITVIHAGREIGALTPGAPDLERRFFDLVRAWDDDHAAIARERR